MLTISDLTKAEKDCAAHIDNLLKDAEFLYHNHKFPNSIFLSIIAIEEIGKYATYCDYLRKLIDMPDSIENKLRKSHNFKLQQLIVLDHKRNQLQSYNPEQIYKSHIDVSVLLKRQKDFNKIKQLCLYYDFKCDKSVNVICHFSRSILKNHLGHFSRVLSTLVFYYGNMEFLRQKYGNRDGIIYLNKITTQDPLHIESLKAVESLSTMDDSIKRFQNVFVELVSLYDKIYPNSTMKQKSVK